ncbi:Molybdopterin synthase sulfur carrier subunit [Paenibacillus sp. CECT 9249]|uniref:molybdopterin converting factor subunit 1 n=1 Tax=Paenibacillus sp. CECT 9249 TaxID=2845385 RepID=UPI001E351FED|nr:molybdopterin converting factor subunit 1 [Paenibacillus sp. CECT 9249]CAH0121124.1 Molybdopterin synthase sulfur carrier subunit [Paenibacillus sp. CECT 9249]
MITVRYFAGMKEVTGKEEEHLPIRSMTVKELIEWAEKTYDRFPFRSGVLHVAVNEEYARLEDNIVSGDVVAFIPPVSGG